MVRDASEAETWRITFETCNHILREVGLDAYQLTMEEEHPIEATAKLLRERQGWINEDGGGFSS